VSIQAQSQQKLTVFERGQLHKQNIRRLLQHAAAVESRVENCNNHSRKLELKAGNFLPETFVLTSKQENSKPHSSTTQVAYK
jgi:hypothetical protein